MMSTPSSIKHRPPLRESLVWALGWTLSVATMFSAYVLIVSVARRSTWFESYQLSTWAIIGGYYLAATVAAFALALLRPLGGTRFGAYVLGAVIGFLVYSSVGVIGEGFSGTTFFIGGIAGLFVGGLGVVAYDQGIPGWRGSASLSTRKLVVYGAALAVALLLLWLDIRYHIINK
jgi:hypothetical protein